MRSLSRIPGERAQAARRDFTIPRAAGVAEAILHAVDFQFSEEAFLAYLGAYQQLTVLKVLSLAGGLTSTAKPGNAVILRQPSPSQQRQQVAVDVKKILALKGEDISLRQNDILYVPDSTGKHALRRSAEIAIAIATGVAIVRVSQ